MLFHKHNYKITEKSNVIQFDEMGYPLRLCIIECTCGKSDQMWIDTIEEDNDVILKWNQIKK